MKESEFQGWIVDLAKRFGWRVWHVPTPMRPLGGGRFVPDSRGAGLPDLVMLHHDPPRLIFAEVKGADGVLSDGQREFLKLARGLAEALREHMRAVDAVLRTAGREGVMPMTWDAAPIGVYTWRPGVEPLIESVLRGKVMIP